VEPRFQPYTGLSFTPGHMLNATYAPEGASICGSSTSPNVHGSITEEKKEIPSES
jgi:hypothetical protein